MQLPRCVASSRAPDKLRLGLELTGLWPHFDPHVFSSVMVKVGMPLSCVVVEDSIAGVRAGVAAGMTVIGFTAGGHCLEDHDQRVPRSLQDRLKKLRLCCVRG